MMKPSITIAVLTASLCVSALAAEDAEQKVSWEKIPEAAAKTLKEQAAGEKITEVSREKDEGKVVFEATFKKDGRVHDVTVDEAGKLVSDEETIPNTEAPAAIRDAIEKAHPGGKVEKLERIKESGRVNYEALISANSKREEIKFDSEGKILEREDKTGAKDKD